MKKSILFILSLLCFQVLFSQGIIKENDSTEHSNDEVLQKNDQKKLTSKEKYAIKMLKSGYRTKSIILKTKLTKKRLRELKKEYL